MLWAARVVARAFGMVGELLSRLRPRPQAPDPAEELRNKLAEARTRDSEPVSAPAEPAPEPDQLPVEPDSTDLASLRRDVHARARALSEEMRGAGEDE
jgi:hypothetical protein